MKFFRFFIIVLIIYSLVLAGLEFTSSKEITIQSFSSIKGASIFTGLNTTFLTFFHWATALVFGICILFESKKKKRYYFFFTQIIVFIILGLSNRLLLHEIIANLYKTKPMYFVLGFVAFEFLLLLLLGDFIKLDILLKSIVYKAGVFLLVLIIVYFLVPQEQALKISLENLSQTWISAFMLIFAFKMLDGYIDEITNKEAKGHALTNRIVVRRTEDERKAAGI